MKKNSFMEGAFIATMGIILVKVIGLIYVIPFNALVGETGGALYGYGYNIYQLFLAISSAGFPFAISKITSEYLALNNKEAVYSTYKIATKLIIIISVMAFIILFIFAPNIAQLIKGNAIGGNSVSDIAFVIRVISFAILVVPFLSVTKGFLQGHKYITPTTISQLIEQIVRVIVILLGTFLALRVFKIGMRNAIGIAVFGAFIGGLAAFIYLRIKIKKSNILKKVDAEDKNINKQIVKKIIVYSVPFIIISLIYNLYNTVDMILVSRTMNDILKVDANITESVISVFTTWGIKLNNIILAVTTGLTTSLIPNIVSSYTSGNKEDVNNKFNASLQCILLLIVPATIFLSLLVEPVWTLFYGKSVYGPVVYKVFVFTALFGGLHSVVVNTLQGLSKYKLVITSVLIGLLINTTFDIPLMLLVDKLGMQSSWGAVFSAMIGYSVSMIISLSVLKNKYKFNFNDTIKRIPTYIVSWIIFIFVILLLKLIIPTDLSSRLIQIPILMIFGVISFIVYLIFNYYAGNLYLFKELRRKKNESRNS